MIILYYNKNMSNLIGGYILLTIEESISRLKINLIRKRPFYGLILMKLNEMKESSSTKIMCTDGNNIYYNKKYMDKLNEAERNFYLLHQLYHCIFMHPSRMINKDTKIANIAADFLVNYYIELEKNEFKKAGIIISVPSNAYVVRNEDDKNKLEKLSFEQLYEIIYNLQKGKNMATPDNNKSDLNSSLINIYGNNINLNKCTNDIITPNNIEKTSSNMRRIIQESIITNKIYGSKLIGDIPGSLVRRITELIGTRVPWYKYLRRYLSNILQDDISFDTPDKNHIYRGLILPGRYEEENSIRDIILLIDTSGSIKNEDLQNFLQQAYDICKDFNAEGKIIFFDSIVQDIFDLNKENITKVPIYGGEGTDVNVALEYIKNERLKYSCILVLTDGYFNKPNILLRNVIWCLTEDGTKESIESYKGSTIIRL